MKTRLGVNAIQLPESYRRELSELSADKALVSGIAGRYAIALFDLAEDRGELAEVERDLSAVQSLLDEGSVFTGLVTSPILSRAQQAEALATVANEAELGATTANFLGVLTENRRLKYLGAVIGSFFKLLASKRGEVTAEVISAQPLSEDQIGALRDRLKAAVGSDVTFDTTVDAGLLGGLVVKVGSRMIDSSVKTKLQNLKTSMKGVG